MENQNELFRKKSLDRISSPEELHDYMRVTSPRLWMILSAIVIMLVGFVVYAAMTRMESTEKVRLRMSGENDAYTRIPEGREELVKIGMEVRVNGRTGHVTQIENNLEYVLDVAFDGQPPTDSDYYVVSIGDSRDVQLMDEEGNYNPNIFYVYQEEGLYFPMGAEQYIIDMLDGDVRARFWTEKYAEEPVENNGRAGDESNGSSGEEYDYINGVTLIGGRLATISRVNQIITTRAYVRLDEAGDPMESGSVFDAEIVTESTTPLSFLLN